MINYNSILEFIPEIKTLTPNMKVEYETELSSLIEKSTDLLAIREKYEEILAMEKQLAEEIHELKNRIFPKITFTIIKHHRNKLPIIQGKSSWRNGINDFTPLSVYIAPLSTYPKGADDPEVKAIALDKIRALIRSKFPLK